MDKTKSPGITLENIQLLECNVGGINQNAELRYSVGIYEFVRTVHSANKLSALVGFDLTMDIVNPACTFTCKFLSSYNRAGDGNMTWEDLPDHVIIAHMVPFFREFVSNMTHRMPISVLIMVPPANTSVLLARFREKSKQAIAQPVTQ
jgi:hypothetical protein